MADLPTDLDLVSPSQAQKEVTGNALWSAMSTAKVFGRREGTSGGLVWGYYGGVSSISGTPSIFLPRTLTLTANQTNYIYMDPSSSPAELTCSTSKPTGWPGPIAGGVIACYEVTVGASSATAWRDWRLGIGTPGAAGATGATGATGAAGTNWSATTNTQTGTSYALQASDNGVTVTLNNGSAITLTVPSGLGANFGCMLIQLGAGQVTVTPSSTTVNSFGGFTKLAGQYAAATLFAYAADTFDLSGALA